MLTKFIRTFAGMLVVALSCLMMAAPAQAQGTTGPVRVSKAGNCPSEYHKGRPGHTSGVGSYQTGHNDPNFCYPETKSPPAVYLRTSTSTPCAEGYFVDFRSEWCSTKKSYTWSAENNLAKGGKLTKPSLEARCPTGWASNSDLRTCYTTLENPPATRLSNGKPCAAGEMEEWGTWCTGSIKAVTYAHADGHGAADFNRVYLHRQLNGGDWQSMKCCLSPAAAAYYKSIGAGPAPVGNAAAPKDDSTSAEEDEARGMDIARGMIGGNSGQAAQPQCDTGSAAGAAVGAAIGGSTGAKIGSMLGGFGRKKKTGC